MSILGSTECAKQNVTVNDNECGVGNYVEYDNENPYKPSHYLPAYPNDKIAKDATVSDIIECWNIRSHPLGEAIAKIIRAGKKRGESYVKDLTKVMEHVRREIEEHKRMQGRGPL